MKVFSIQSAVISLIVAIAIGGFLNARNKTPSYLPWHNNEHWLRFFKIYDKFATRYFHDCDSKIVNTTFGATQLHACGHPGKPPVLLLHGAASNSLIYGDWLMPALRDSHYAIAADFPCDVGKSIPMDSNPEKCPSSEQDLADWVQQIASELSVQSPISLIGYSYGLVISFVTALHKPDLVNKLVLLAPAAIFAPIDNWFILRSLVYGLTRTSTTYNWFLRYLSAEPDFDMNKMHPDYLELTVAIRQLGATILVVPANSYADNVLERVIRKHPTFLGIGECEKIINATLAVERAQTAGAQQVKLYPNAGHLMLMEMPAQEQIVHDVVEFLREQ